MKDVVHGWEHIEQLRVAYPDWEIWTVDLIAGGTQWCARRWDDHTRVLSGWSAGEVAEYIAASGAPYGR